MDKVYNHKDVEEKIYKNWEEKGYFKPEVNKKAFDSKDSKDKYSIILPPPNANGDLHFGHAMFVIEDILIRFKRMQGYAALWLPGTDHAGTETQFVFEKKLQEQGKSRFDFNREELYQMIWKYVAENQGGIESQLKRLGFSLDWSRSKFTLDEDIVKLVSQTFRNLYQDGLVERDYRLVNYCTKDGTSFSDLETISEEKEGILYHIKYPIKDGGFITVATTRPETMYGDVAVMVHPDDQKYQNVIGKKVLLPLTDREIPIIADKYVEKEFGTGAVKVTPSHDFNDFEVGRRHELTFPPIIGWNGKFEKTGVVDGLYAKQARELTVEKLKELGLLDAEKPHPMVIKKCYKCKTILEPLPLEQWYLRVNKKVDGESLVDNALYAIKGSNPDIKIEYPSADAHLRFWYRNLKDWNISRQNVWGIRIPVWYQVTNESKFAVSFLDKDGNLHQGTLDQMLKAFQWEEIVSGLQRVIATIGIPVVFEEEKIKGEKDGKRYLPETDTFDTWFSSGQWPVVTLKTSKKDGSDYEKFYPTSVMETGRDILFFWVSRMIMLGIYIRNKELEETQSQIELNTLVPFQTVVLHGMVLDPLGKKMSKSKGNVVNPLQVADDYGADAVRFALVYGTGLGNDQAMSYPKLEAARKFANKLWNMARFIEFKQADIDIKKIELSTSFEDLFKIAENASDKKWIEETVALTKDIKKYLDSYQFNLAAERLYEFAWHEFADVYIEEVKNRIDVQSFTVLLSLYVMQLKLLHPFMPFITEEIYQKLPGHGESIMIESWPKS